MKVQCPNCQKIQNAPDDSVGKRARCKSCRDTFVIINEYTPPQIVPLGDLPDPDDIPITVDAPPPKDRSDNIFARAWIGIPGPFITSFLATLGVVSALLFAWYVVRIPAWFNRPPTAPTAARQQLADTDIPSAQLLTELLHCCRDYTALAGVGDISAARAINDGIMRRPISDDLALGQLQTSLLYAVHAEIRRFECVAGGGSGLDIWSLRATQLRDQAGRQLAEQKARFGVAE